MQVGDKKARVLVVDDERRMRQSVVDLVKVQGYQVDAADGGRAAIECLRRAEYDLVLLDLHAGH
jgi:DNA-binding response OmpR family regulator